MGNIQPYGRLKGRNHVGIYLFETISEQVFSASADCIENAAVRQTEKNTLLGKRVADQRRRPFNGRPIRPTTLDTPPSHGS